MDVSRRGFVLGQSAVLGLALAPRTLLAAVEGATKPTPPTESWEAVRKLWNLSPEWLHFSGFFIASHPAPVRDAIDAYRKTIDANPYAAVDEGLFPEEGKSVQQKVRDDIAEYLGAKGEDVALVSNTTSGLSLVYGGLTLKAGDEILTTTHDHYVHHVASGLAAKRTGASVRKIALYEDSAKVTVAGVVDRLRREIKPATRIVGTTWVSSQSGVRLPIKELAAVVADANKGRPESDRIMFIVDGVHGLGCVDATVSELGCDIFVAGTHKWMFAPRGTGIVWAKSATWARLTPWAASFAEEEQFDAWAEGRDCATPSNASRMSPGGFLAYEHQWAMSAAFRMHRDIGRAKVGARIAELNGMLKDGLARIPGLTLHTPRDPALSAGVCSFSVKNRETHDIVQGLKTRHVIASGSPYRPSLPRLAASLFNTPDEVKKVIEAVRGVVTS